MLYLSWTDGLAQLTCNASLLSIRVAAKGMFSTEAGRQRPFLKRVVDGGRLTKQVTHGHGQTWRKVSPENETDVTHVKGHVYEKTKTSYTSAVHSVLQGLIICVNVCILDIVIQILI